MELGIKDRLVLLQALAGVSGTIAEIRIIHELRESLSFTEQEHKKLGLQVIEGQGFAWKPESEFTKEVEIGEVAHKIIVKRLKELDAQGQITEDILDILGKFPEVEDE